MPNGTGPYDESEYQRAMRELSERNGYATESAPIPYGLNEFQSGQIDLAEKARLEAAKAIDYDVGMAQRVLNVAGQTGLPAEIIESNIDDLEKKLRSREFDVDKYKKESPAYASFIAENRYHLAALKDDRESMTGIERAFKPIVLGWKSTWAQVERSKLQSRMRQHGEQEGDKELLKKLKELEQPHAFGAETGFGKWFVENVKMWGPTIYSTGHALKRGVQGAAVAGGVGAGIGVGFGGVGAAPGAVTGLVAGFGAGFSAGMAEATFELESGFAFEEYKETMPLDQAAIASDVTGAINAGLEAFSLGMTLKYAGKAGKAVFGDKIMKALGKSVTQDVLKRKTMGYSTAMLLARFGQVHGTEVITEGAQEAVTIGVGEIAQRMADGGGEDFDVARYSARVVDAMEQTFKHAVIMSSMGPVMNYSTDLMMNRDAKSSQVAWDLVARGIKDSKTADTLKGVHRQFYEKMIKHYGKVEKIYITPDAFATYFQKIGEDPAEIAESLGIENYEGHSELGTSLEVDAATFVEKIAGRPEHIEALSGDIKVDLDELTANEARVRESDVKAEWKAMREEADNAGRNELHQEVLLDIEGQLVSQNYEEGEAHRAAKQMADVFINVAERHNLDPKKIVSTYLPRIMGEIPEGFSNFDSHMESMIERVRSGAFYTESEIYGQNLIDFLDEAGGLNDFDSEFLSRDLERLFPELFDAEKSKYKKKPGWKRRPGKGSTGLTPDAAAELANEANFIAAHDVDLFFAAIDSEIEALDPVSGVKPLRAEGKTNETYLAINETVQHIADFLDQAGIDLSTVTNEDVLKIINSGNQKEYFQSLLSQQTYFQEGHRGSYTINQLGERVIRLTKSKNAATFLHESGHLYLDMMGDLSEAPGAPKSIVEEYVKILKYLKVKSRKDIKTEQHEIFARSYEAYLREGKAPSIEQKEMFASFSAWLRMLYKSITKLNVRLNDEIRGVFDRMLASEEAIKQAQSQQSYVSLFTSEEDALEKGVSKEAYRVYQKSLRQVHEDEVDRQSTKLLASIKRETMKWWKNELEATKTKVAEEVHQMRVYKALYNLRYGANPDRTPLNTQGLKIDRDSLLLFFYGEKEPLRKMPGGTGKTGIYRVKGGVDIDVVAGHLGYDSASEMIDEIVSAPDMGTYIDSQARSIMARKYPDPLVDGTLPQAAIDTVHSGKRAEIQAAEANMLAQMANADRAIVAATKRQVARERAESKRAFEGMLPKRVDMPVIRAAALEAQRDKRYRDISPRAYQGAERNALRKAHNFAAVGKFFEAWQEQMRAIRNHAMYQAAIKARDEHVAGQKYLKNNFVKIKKTSKLWHSGMVPHILTIIDGIDFRQHSLKEVDRIKALTEMEEAVKRGELYVPEGFLEGLRVRVTPRDPSKPVTFRRPVNQGKNWQDYTVKEFIEIVDVVRQLHKKAKLQTEAVLNGKKVLIDDGEQALVNSIESTYKFKRRRIGGRKFGKKALQKIEGASDSWLGISVIANLLDDGEMGAFNKHIVIPMRKAYTEKLMPMLKKAEVDVSNIYLKHYDFDTMKSLRDKFYIEEFGQELTRGDIISILLNLGTETNRGALYEGIADPGTVYARTAYPRAGVDRALAHLDKRDLEFANSIWEYNESYWGQFSDSEFRKRGYVPEKQEATPFTLTSNDGHQVNLTGGYITLQYDRRHGAPSRAEKDSFDSISMLERVASGGHVSAQTAPGARHDRKIHHKLVVQLDLNIISRHLREIVRDIAIGDEVNYIKRLMNRPKVRGAFTAARREETLKTIDNWLIDSAIGELPADGFFNWMASHTRTGFVVAKLGFNAATTLLQFTGFAQTAAVIGSTTMLKGVAEFISDPMVKRQEVFNKSAFMNARYVLNTFDKDIHDVGSNLESLYGPAPTRVKSFMGKAKGMYFAPIMHAQSAVDISTWLGSYKKAQQEKGLSGQEAINYADAQVELSQTSGLFSDRSGIERGTVGAGKWRQNQFLRLWTTLIGYMLRKGNIAYMKTSQLAKKGKRGEMSVEDVGKYLGDMMLLFTLEGIASALLYGDSPDDDQGWAAWTGIKTIESVASGLPFLREIPSAKYGSGTTSLGSLSNDFWHLGVQLRQLADPEMDDQFDLQLFKASMNVGGTLFHLPTGQFLKTAKAISAASDGEDIGLHEYVLGPRK